MFKKIFITLLFGILLLAVTVTKPSQAHAQGPSSQSQMLALLQSDGFTLLTAGTMAADGDPAGAYHVFVVMPFADNAPNVKYYASTHTFAALEDEYYAHVIVGYRALRQVFPTARTMTVVVIDVWHSITFTTDTSTFDRSEATGFGQAAFKTNQLGSLFFANLVTGELTQANELNTGNSAAQPSPTAVPAVGLDKPCDYYDVKPAAGDALFYVRNQYQNHDLTFTIGGDAWGTHDYKFTGDSKWYYINIPPGEYTWTASVNGVGGAGSGARQGYEAGWCYSEDFRG